MNIQDMNGCELLQAMKDGKLPRASISNTMGIDLAKVEPGFVQFEATATKAHLNPLGGVHGGFAATALDSATGCAIHSLLEPGVGYGTIDLNVKMMRPVPVDTKLFAEGKVINISKSIGMSEARLVDAGGKLYAHATCTCKIIRGTP